MLDAATDSVVQKVLKRIIPFCIIAYLLNYVDRTNISLAKLGMTQTAPGVPPGSVPGFTADVFDKGLAIFFLAYFIFELPSNLIMERVGARRWIARIMISWGIISAGFMLTSGPWSFYGLRVLLGIAEAGFFPGILLYLSYWVPHQHRARATGLFFISQALAQVVGNTMGAFILYFTGKYHVALAPWQWLFLSEGIPSVLFGIVVLIYLTDKPADAKWLTADERKRLMDVMAHEKKHTAGHSASDLWHALASPYMWLFSALYFFIVWAFFPVNFYTPTMLKQVMATAGTIVLPGNAAGLTPTPEHITSLYVGLLSAIPFGAAVVSMMLIARHSDRHNERKYHVVCTISLMAVGLVLAAFAPTLPVARTMQTVLLIVGLSLVAVGTFGTFAPFWALPPQFLTGTAGAAAFAIINSIGNLASFFAPNVRSYFKWNNDSNPDHLRNNLLLAAAFAVAGVILTLSLHLPKHKIVDMAESPVTDAVEELA